MQLLKDLLSRVYGKLHAPIPTPPAPSKKRLQLRSEAPSEKRPRLSSTAREDGLSTAPTTAPDAAASIQIAARDNSVSADRWWMVDLHYARANRGDRQGASYLVRRCMETHGWPESKARRVLKAYRQFLALKQATQDWDATRLSPPLLVDKMWHAHILDVVNYVHDMMLLCGHVVGHNPDGALDEEAKAERIQATRAALLGRFAEECDADIWVWQGTGGVLGGIGADANGNAGDAETDANAGDTDGKAKAGDAETDVMAGDAETDANVDDAETDAKAGDADVKTVVLYRATQASENSQHVVRKRFTFNLDDVVPTVLDFIFQSEGHFRRTKAKSIFERAMKQMQPGLDTTDLEHRFRFFSETDYTSLYSRSIDWSRTMQELGIEDGAEIIVYRSQTGC